MSFGWHGRDCHLPVTVQYSGALEDCRSPIVLDCGGGGGSVISFDSGYPVLELKELKPIKKNRIYRHFLFNSIFNIEQTLSFHFCGNILLQGHNTFNTSWHPRKDLQDHLE